LTSNNGEDVWFTKPCEALSPLAPFRNPKSKTIFAVIMSKSTDELFKNVIAHAKEYGFVFPSSEIYDGLSAVYDYGQNGAELKNNIKTYWWKAMVQMNDNIVGIDSAIFMHPKIWKASGHVDGFSDPMIDNKDSEKTLPCRSVVRRQN
jgi:glycyl-tRNA synthetase